MNRSKYLVEKIDYFYRTIDHNSARLKAQKLIQDEMNLIMRESYNLCMQETNDRVRLALSTLKSEIEKSKFQT